MKVVFHSTDDDRLALQVQENAADVAMRFFS
jgi:hypothetical protein